MSENNNKQKRKRVCPHCGRKLWMREFYPLKNGGRSSWCHECVLAYKREQYRKHRKVADGTFMHRTLGRLVEHKGYSTRIYLLERQYAFHHASPLSQYPQPGAG